MFILVETILQTDGIHASHSRYQTFSFEDHAMQSLLCLSAGLAPSNLKPYTQETLNKCAMWVHVFMMMCWYLTNTTESLVWLQWIVKTCAIHSWGPKSWLILLHDHASAAWLKGRKFIHTAKWIHVSGDYLNESAFRLRNRLFGGKSISSWQDNKKRYTKWSWGMTWVLPCLDSNHWSIIWHLCLNSQPLVLPFSTWLSWGSQRPFLLLGSRSLQLPRLHPSRYNCHLHRGYIFGSVRYLLWLDGLRLGIHSDWMTSLCFRFVLNS